VLVLEDGNRSGDVATSSGDHAVSIDPASAERIEIVRGPAGLLYGSNALGGVINVIREDVPHTRPERTSGQASIQAESVNSGMSSSAEVHGAASDIAWRAEVSGRFAGDTQTPLGALPSTDLSGYGAGLGASWVRPEGFAGLAVRDYQLTYGVPGTFQGQEIPGAPEGGVTIDMRRISGLGSAAWLAGWGPFSSIALDGTWTWYKHQEIEPSGDIGTEIGQTSGSARLVARHHHTSGTTRREGALGLWAMGRDFSVTGSETGSRPAREYVGAVFGYEELGWNRFQLQFGARYDHSRVTPLDTSPGPLGEVFARNFGAVSGSVASIVDLGAGVSMGVSASRAFRTPSIEELFSDGPHLAEFSYNIGNPSLSPEIGLGTDAFIRYSSSRARGEVGIFRNGIHDFVHYLPTGEMDPEQNRYPVYQAGQTDAVLKGGEGTAEWEVLPSFVLRSTFSLVRGNRTDNGSPLPEIPPVQWSQSARYERPWWFASLEWHGGAAQKRVAENETPTDGYSLLDAGIGFRWSGWGGFHSVTVNASNLTDTVWRDHLSRIRAVAPQPGRNLRVVYHIEL
jgi:iron complex outermembrane receptor protein